METNKIRVGIIGLGYWGPNYIRNFNQHPETEVVWGCDLSEKSLLEIKRLYPKLNITQNYEELLSDKSLDLVAIATPPDSHFEIAKKALENNKHVLVAKPLASSSSQVLELIKIAKEKNLMLHCDLTYLYTSAIREIKKVLNSNVIGTPTYYDSTRTNLGLFQKDVNVIWDLAPHDLAILEYLFNLKPEKVLATASKHHENSLTEEIAHIAISYEKNFVAHIHVSWLSPVKIRTILVGGTEKMILFDDLDPDEKVKIYDKGVQISTDSITPFKPVYRSGDVIIPKLTQEEALFLEVKELVSQIKAQAFDYTNSQMNEKIIRILEACDESIKSGKAVDINP